MLIKLKRRGKKIYQDLIDYLKDHGGGAQEVDEFVISELAFYCEQFMLAAEMVNKEGAVQVYKSKATALSGYSNACTKFSSEIRSLSHKLGIYEIMKKKLHEYGKAQEAEGLLR